MYKLMYGFIIGGDMSDYECPHCKASMIWHEFGKGEDTEFDTVCENSKCKGSKMKEYETCDVCDGEGEAIWSCCGDNILHEDTDLCPSCSEHCGDEIEECEECKGTGALELCT